MSGPGGVCWGSGARLRRCCGRGRWVSEVFLFGGSPDRIGSDQIGSDTGYAVRNSERASESVLLIDSMIACMLTRYSRPSRYGPCGYAMGVLHQGGHAWMDGRIRTGYGRSRRRRHTLLYYFTYWIQPGSWGVPYWHGHEHENMETLLYLSLVKIVLVFRQIKENQTLTHSLSICQTKNYNYTAWPAPVSAHPRKTSPPRPDPSPIPLRTGSAPSS